MLTINKHRQMYDADYAVVLAPGFGNGQVIEQAIAANVVLLPVEVLCDLLRLHAVTPLSVLDYRVLFETPGLVRQLPTVLCDLAATQERRTHCLMEVFRIMESNLDLGIDRPLSVETLHTVLRRESSPLTFTEEDVAIAFSLLVNGVIGAARQDQERRLTLAMNAETLAWKLETLATVLRQKWGNV